VLEETCVVDAVVDGDVRPLEEDGLVGSADEHELVEAVDALDGVRDRAEIMEAG
jgi:hypothetical protein